MREHSKEVARYFLNGVVATIVHFVVLSFNLHILSMPSAGMANLVAAVFGIVVSFLGSHYFVFPKNDESFIKKAIKFSGLYGVVAVLHGLVLLVWTDWMALDYRIGFLLATGLQVILSYTGNKFLVFRI